MKDLSRRHYCEGNRNLDNSKHVLSNNDVLYEFKGFDITDARSMDGAKLFEGFLCSEEFDSIKIETYSRRVQGKNAWEYTLLKNGKVCGTAYDYITNDGTFIREFNLATPIRFKLRLENGVTTYAPGIMVMKKGTPYVNDYKTAEDVYFRFDGASTSICCYGQDTVYYLERKSKMIICINKDIEKLSSEDEKEYNFTDFKVTNDAIKDIEEDAYYVHKSLTYKNGASLSAIPWNMCYVRDSFGMCRGYLSMNMFKETKDILAFFNKGFMEKQTIATAISLGNDKTLHIHENDFSENTGYIIILAFLYLKYTNDVEFFNSLLPLLKMAYNGAKKLLVDGMMPFSGDETYVAGNLIPRVCVDEGSAEATLLFIESTKMLIPYLDESEKEEAKQLVNEATSKYKENFVVNNKIMANNPKRLINATLKETRKGVCPYCYSYGKTFLNKYKLYACSNCINKDEDIRNHKQFYLTSVSLMPLYIDSLMFSKDELIKMYEEFAINLIDIYYNDKKTLTKISGYEYGLLLYGLVKLNSKYMHDIYKICIKARDSEHAWSEYYIDGNCCGMRWRNWETGVNMLAIEAYIEYMKNENNA